MTRRRKVKCSVCLDEGYLLYTVPYPGSNFAGTGIAHCICPAGERYKYSDGTARVPCIDEIADPVAIGTANRATKKNLIIFAGEAQR